MALPPAHLLVGAAAAECARPSRVPVWKAWAVGACVAVAPDLDSALLLAAGRTAPMHGVYTHTLLAVAAVSLLAWWFFDRRWALIAGGAWLSHLLVDVLREGAQANVYPAAPFSLTPLEPLFPLFTRVAFDWKGGVAAVPELAGPNPLHALVLQTLAGCAVLAVVAVSSAILRARGGRAG